MSGHRPWREIRHKPYGLTTAQRDAIDLAMLDIVMADFEAGNMPRSRELRLMRAAYLQGRVDQEMGRQLGAPDAVTTTERSSA